MNPTRVLCIGADSMVLQTRCAVLERSGYRAQGIMFAEAEQVLSRKQFAVVILCASLSDWQKEAIAAFVVDTTPIIKLDEIAFAAQLLRELEQRLA